MAKQISLVDAALRLGLAYQVVMRLVITRRLDGGRDANGRWFVVEKSIAQFVADQEKGKRRTVRPELLAQDS